VTAALVGIGGAVVAVALNVRGDPVKPTEVAVMVTGPAVPPRVTLTAETPDASVGMLAAETLPPVAAQSTPTPGTPFPN
jgi:hypothetical protein